METSGHSIQSAFSCGDRKYQSTKLIATHPKPDIDNILRFAYDKDNTKAIEQCILVRVLETALLDLFGKGKLHGTIHTCVGQELTGILVGRNLTDGDFVTSNHRCHGHFIGATGNWRGLIDEIIGNEDGVCGGIGSSQHLHSSNFLSNGQQGGLLPVGAGIALDRKRRAADNVVISFIGEGTFGEGIIYETMNISSLWDLPHLIICENNLYSQSTPQEISIAGELGTRALAFGIRTAEANIWDPIELSSTIADSMAFVKASSKPAFLNIKTYRLNAHSKGDDFRNPDEVEIFRQRDPLNIIMRERNDFNSLHEALKQEIAAYIECALQKPKLELDTYLSNQLPRFENRKLLRLDDHREGMRISQQLNKFYAEYLASNKRAFFLGEDVHDPYGGAFKIAAGLQSQFPDRVISTPISEAAITGIGIGLAVAGNRPMVEVMFGDFMTLTFDQLVNNASKFFHMYNKKVHCPLILRSPMGGRRGYGPTHSQSLERLLIGIDNLMVISVNSLIDVATQLSGLALLQGPAIVLENKTDYTLLNFRTPPELVMEVEGEHFPTVTIKLCGAEPDVTLVSYGNMARVLADHMLTIFDESDLIPELIVLTALHPLDIAPICESVSKTQRLVVVEEGALFGGVGAELISQVLERMGPVAQVLRIGGKPVPIPSVPFLEDLVLPSVNAICQELQLLRIKDNAKAG